MGSSSIPEFLLMLNGHLEELQIALVNGFDLLILGRTLVHVVQAVKRSCFLGNILKVLIQIRINLRAETHNMIVVPFKKALVYYNNREF